MKRETDQKVKRRIGECVHCGKMAELSKDHVIPECLFVKPFPPNLITVQACDKCNNAKSKDDDYLKDLLVCDIFGNQSPIAQKIFQEKVRSSQRKNKSVIGRDAVTKAKIQPFYTKGGLYLGHLPTYPLDEMRLTNLLARIVRGLYYDACQLRFPKGYTFDVHQFRPWEFKEVWKIFSKMNFRQRILGNVFGCAFVRTTEDPFTTWWVLWFYEGVFFYVLTDSPKLAAERIAE